MKIKRGTIGPDSQEKLTKCYWNRIRPLVSYLTPYDMYCRHLVRDMRYLAIV